MSLTRSIIGFIFWAVVTLVAYNTPKLQWGWKNFEVTAQMKAALKPK
jgi:hypothetical protein